MPPEQRGQQVHVVQDLGSRRMDAIPTDGPNWPQAEPWPQPYVEPPPPEEARHARHRRPAGPPREHLHRRRRPPPSGGRQQPARRRRAGLARIAAHRPRDDPRGRRLAGQAAQRRRHQRLAGRAARLERRRRRSWRGVPSSGSGSGSSGGGGLGNIGSGGGGGNGGEAMVVLAVVLAAIAVVTTVSLVCSEGIRFDGLAQMSPWQPVHLKQDGGGELVIALGDLSPVAIEGAVEAKVMDDEGYGIRTLDHLRLDRRWAPTFKLDAGSMTFARGGGDARSGFVSNMQFGLFVRPWLGLLLTAGVGGAGDEYGATITRHIFGFETQSLPLALGPGAARRLRQRRRRRDRLHRHRSGRSNGATRSAPASWASCRSRRAWRSRCAPARTRRSSPTAARRHPPPPSPPASRSYLTGSACCGRPRSGGGWRRRRGRRRSAPARCAAARLPQGSPVARPVRAPARSRKPRRPSPAR